VTERLAREIVAVTKLPEFKKRLTDIGAEEVEPLIGDAFGRYMLEEVRRWREMAAAVGIKGE
jgi:hypothetical protein